ncbi:bifunctional diguanylate cyclase/phosphodiesterase [Xenophilus aerolatus]|nr:bifunctional diguanylate cyclase/phosphodiesterase [Xenophilus aerolatus]
MTVRPSSRRALTTLYGVATLFMLTVALAAGALSAEMRHRALEKAGGQVARQVSAAQAAIDRSLRRADSLLADMAARADGASLAQALGATDRDAASAQLRQQVGHDPVIRQLAYLDEELRVLAASNPRARGRPVDLPAGFAQRLRAQADASLAVGISPGAPNSALSILHLGRRAVLADGRELFAVAEVPLAALGKLLEEGADLPGLEATLESADGTLLVRLPDGERTGRPAAPAPGRPVADGVAHLAPSRLGGHAAVVAARPAFHRQLVVTASQPQAQVLAGWKRDRLAVAAGAAGFLAMILAAALFSHVQLRRQGRDRQIILQSKLNLDQALESMVDGLVLLDPRDRVLAWNRRFVELFPWVERAIAPHTPFRQLIEMTLEHLRGQGLDVSQNAWLAGDLRRTRGVQDEQELAMPGGRSILAVKSPMPDGGIVCVFRDTTERRQHIADVVKGKAQLQATLDALPDQLLEVGLDGRCFDFHCPPGVASGLLVDQPVGLTLAEVLPPDGNTEVMAALREAYVAGRCTGRQFERRASQGTSWFEASVSRKPVGEGADARFIVILRNITETKAATQEIEHLAFYDALTGLPNRRLLLHRLQGCVDNNARHQRQGALLFLDIDDFKRLNDAHGQAVGDDMLRQVAARLQDVLRDGGMLARLAGDEFVLMLENLSHDHALAMVQARALADNAMARMAEPFRLARIEYHSTCSIGVCVFDGGRRSIEDLLKQADIAMYYAKLDGGHAVRVFEPAMKTTVTARAALDSELHVALKKRQFVLHYQPQVNHLGRVVGAEALIRWNHPVRGMVPPAGFIEPAEQTGLIVPIGLWALEEACGQLERWGHDARYAHLTLSVNVSARQFRKEDFAEEVRQVLIRTGCQPSRLKLELTESLLHDQVTETISKMKSLAAIGIRFSMDDFGIGFSSLSYMARLPLHQLKVDKFFVQGIGQNPKIELIVQTILGMAANLDLEVVAEGVETEGQLAFLQAHGCKVSQGYYFGRPEALSDFEHRLKEPTPGVARG